MAKARVYGGELSVGSGASPIAVVGNYVEGTPTVTYYVSTSGSDSNNGTSSATPWQTLAKLDAMTSSFTAGMVIALKRGDTWNETLYCYNCTAATLGNPIIYTAYGSGALPIIDGQNTRDRCVDFNNVEHVVVSNLTLRNALFDGLAVREHAVDVVAYNISSSSCGRDCFSHEATDGVTDQDNIEVSRCTAYSAGRCGFFAHSITQAGSVGVHYYNCKATYCGRTEANHGFSAFFANKVHWHGCEAAFTNIVEGTGLPDTWPGSEGIGFAFDDESGNGSCTYCYTHDNKGPGIAAGHQADANLIAYNVSANNGGAGIVLNGDPAGSDNVLIYNNTCVDNDSHGIEVLNPTTGALIKNNIVANNGGFGIRFTSSGNTSYTVATNVIYNNTSGATSNVSGATGTVTGNPTLDGSYVPIAGSSAINAGLDLTSTYKYGLYAGSSWPLAVNKIDQSAFGSWEIGAYVST